MQFISKMHIHHSPQMEIEIALDSFLITTNKKGKRSCDSKVVFYFFFFLSLSLSLSLLLLIKLRENIDRCIILTYLFPWEIQSSLLQKLIFPRIHNFKSFESKLIAFHIFFSLSICHAWNQNSTLVCPSIIKHDWP